MIKLPSYLTSFRSRADGSASVTFGTQELAPDDFADLKRNLNAFGWVVFKPNEDAIAEGDLPKEDAVEDGLTPSQVLHKRLYVFWKKKIGTGDFNVWYRQRLDTFGQKHLEQLD